MLIWVFCLILVQVCVSRCSRLWRGCSVCNERKRGEGRDATGLRFSEFPQKSESFGVYNVNIADFTQISEYFYCLLKLFNVMRQTCFPSQ